MANLTVMTRWFALRRLLVILALLGVVMAPLGETMAAPAMAAQSMAAMADDMPCCPNHLQTKMDCTTSCPFVGLCVAGLSSVVLPEAASINLSSLVGVSFSRGESFALSSLVGEPPSRPPKR